MKDRTTTLTRAPHPGDTVATTLKTFPAGAPRGSWPAEQYAADLTAAGTPATVVMDLATDTFKVVAKAVAA
ncbi:hypothetical protein ACFV0T_26265 [Streptomyces sp. NPDC059582]|uniref:hypothetical protein n=1 Tax=Streptomyces sp. NPDC059582 TaxID=3346875 RepID=UPI00368E80FC